MKALKWMALVCVLFAASAWGQGVAVGNASVGKSIFSPDKSMSISIPKGWVEDRELHDTADLQASNRAEECYIIVLTDSKDDFEDMTLVKHSETTRKSLLSSLTAPEVLGPTKMTIDGKPALQYEIRGSIDNLKVTYLHTTVETPKHFQQILTWTLRSRFDKNKPILQQVATSFREVRAEK